MPQPPGPPGGRHPGRDPAPARAARRPWRDYWQLVPVALLMCALVAVDRFRRGAQAAGLVNAVTINRLSRPAGGGGALAMNHWLVHHPVPAAAAAAYYMVLQVLVTAAAGIWLSGSGHPSFRRHRDALIVTGVTGLVAFWVYPVAAPRMLPGYRDTVDAIGPSVLAPAGNQGRRRVRRLPLPARHLGAVGGRGLPGPAAPPQLAGRGLGLSGGHHDRCAGHRQPLRAGCHHRPRCPRLRLRHRRAARPGPSPASAPPGTPALAAGRRAAGR